MADRATTVWILLSDRVAPLTDAPAVVAPHGHFRDWFAETRRRRPCPGACCSSGASAATRASTCCWTRSLGSKTTERPCTSWARPRTRSWPTTCAERRPQTTASPRSTTSWPTSVLAREVFESELVVLPFVEMTNSGSMLLALSLDRPVLVPRLPVTEELADEVGPGWVAHLRRRARRHHHRPRAAPSAPRATRPLRPGLGTDRTAPRPRVPAGPRAHGSLRTVVLRIDVVPPRSVRSGGRSANIPHGSPCIHGPDHPLWSLSAVETAESDARVARHTERVRQGKGGGARADRNGIAVGVRVCSSRASSSLVAPAPMATTRAASQTTGDDARVDTPRATPARSTTPCRRHRASGRRAGRDRRARPTSVTGSPRG